MKTLISLTLLALATTSFAELPKRVLFIGNSYTGGIKRTMDAMLNHEGIEAEIRYINPGGKTLSWHWSNGTTNQIVSGNWDVVVMQEQSQTPAYPGNQEKFWTAGGQLADLIRSQGGRPMYYMTWGRRDGDRHNLSYAPNYAVMQDRLSASYAKAAEIHQAELAPCGEVWRKVRLVDPPLGKKLYRNDGSHPSEYGAYLVAATFTAVLFKKAPTSIGYKGGLSKVERQVIQKAIARTLGE